MLSRRELLAGAATCAILSAVPAFSQTTLLSGGTIGAFNGGRSQVNFNFIGGGEFPFINVVKMGTDWTYRSSPNKDSQVSPSVRDANGYPITIQTNGYNAIAIIPSQTDRPGNYVFRWVGNGTMINPGTLVSGSTSGTNGRFVFTPTGGLTAVGMSLIYGVATIGSPYVSDIAIMHVDDEADWLAGEMFGKQFEARLLQAKFGVLRFLNWQLGNTNMMTTWATRKPVSYSSWIANQWFPALWAGQTTNTANDYAITFGSGGPVDKQIIHLQFSGNAATTGVTGITISNSASTGVPTVIGWTAHGLSLNDPVSFEAANSLPAPMMSGNNFYVSNVIDADHFNIAFMAPGAGNFSTTNGGGNPTYTGVRLATLNLNSTGAVPIKQQWGDAARDASQPETTINNAGVNILFATLVYDADLNSWLKNGGDTLGFSKGVENGVPFEVMLQLCMEVGAHPYFVAPYLALDPMSDLYPMLATYMKAAAPPWMIPRYEGVNEQWNTAGGFYGSRYGWNKANIHWRTQFDTHNWQGKTISTLGQAVNAAYGGAVGGSGNLQYQLLNGSQTVSFSSTIAANTNNPRMTSALYVAQAAAAQPGYTKSAASGWCTHLCIAQYFNPSEFNTGQETTDAASYAAAAGNAPLQLQIATTYADTISGAASGFNLAQNNIYFGFGFTFAQGFTNSAGNKLKMCGYEGGYSPDLTGTAQVNALRNASKFVDDIGKGITGGTLVSGATVTGIYNDFVNAGGEFPSCFQLAGSANIWSVLDPTVYVSPQPAQWTAIAAFNH